MGRGTLDLVLWRHVQAADTQPGQSDLDRALTPKGRWQAEQVAAWLQRHLPGDAAVLSSAARRTVQALGRTFRTDEALAADRDAQALLAAAGWSGGLGVVLVVGHQPTLGQAAALLPTGVEQPWSVRKGAVWWLRQRQRLDQSQTLLVAVQSPELL